MSIIIRLLINAFAIFAAAYILPGVHIDSFLTAVIVAVVLGVSNVIIKPILVILTLPFTILTLGLFMFVVNGFLIVLATKLVPGFSVENFWWAILLSLIISLINSFLQSLRG